MATMDELFAGYEEIEASFGGAERTVTFAEPADTVHGSDAGSEPFVDGTDLDRVSDAQIAAVSPPHRWPRRSEMTDAQRRDANRRTNLRQRSKKAASQEPDTVGAPQRVVRTDDVDQPSSQAIHEVETVYPGDNVEVYRSVTRYGPSSSDMDAPHARCDDSVAKSMKPSFNPKLQILRRSDSSKGRPLAVTDRDVLAERTQFYSTEFEPDTPGNLIGHKNSYPSKISTHHFPDTDENMTLKTNTMRKIDRDHRSDNGEYDKFQKRFIFKNENAMLRLNAYHHCNLMHAVQTLHSQFSDDLMGRVTRGIEACILKTHAAPKVDLIGDPHGDGPAEIFYELSMMQTEFDTRFIELEQKIDGLTHLVNRSIEMSHPQPFFMNPDGNMYCSNPPAPTKDPKERWYEQTKMDEAKKRVAQ